MDFISTYTSTAKKTEINNDAKIPQDQKDRENSKIVLSEDAFALCSILDKLNHSLANK